eukprot:scaffold764_cov363-Pavlova_lutheri.AAC.2
MNYACKQGRRPTKTQVNEFVDANFKFHAIFHKLWVTTLCPKIASCKFVAMQHGYTICTLLGSQWAGIQATRNVIPCISKVGMCLSSNYHCCTSSSCPFSK